MYAQNLDTIRVQTSSFVVKLRRRNTYEFRTNNRCTPFSNWILPAGILKRWFDTDKTTEFGNIHDFLIAEMNIFTKTICMLAEAKNGVDGNHRKEDEEHRIDKIS